MKQAQGKRLILTEERLPFGQHETLALEARFTTPSP